jgi:DinB superfamily
MVEETAYVGITMLDFGPYRRKEKTLTELTVGLGRDDLVALTNEMIDRELELMEGVEDADVVFVPDDPEANDTFAADDADVDLAWTLGHVIVHATASSEEAAAHALELARGLVPAGRSRYEVPWQETTSAGFLRRRLAESRRMRLAMLAAWPDEPHLETLYRPRPESPGVNAVARFVGGLSHDDSHLEQIEKIVAQARDSRSAPARRS